jgi:hypothetical protein
MLPLMVGGIHSKGEKGARKEVLVWPVISSVPAGNFLSFSEAKRRVM